MGNTTTTQIDLHDLIREGDMNSIRHIMSQGINPNALNQQGKSLLLIALESGRANVFKLLYDLGGRILPPLQNQQTPLHAAVQQNQLKIARELLRDGQIAYQMKDAKDASGRTPLHYAAANGNSEMVALLIKYNAEKNIRDIAGRTPADLAVVSSNPDAREIVEQLVAEDLISRFRVQKSHETEMSPKAKESGSTCESKTWNEPLADNARGLLERALLQHNVTVIPSNQLEFDEAVNRGSSCIVLKGKWRGTVVAIKQFKVEYTNNEKELSKFVKELTVLADVRHPNLLLLMGICIDMPNLCMITEYVANQTLFAALYRNKKRILNLSERFHLGIQICRGLAYLHGFQPPIIHRDLKPENCLVSSNQLDASLHLKIADFGLARPLSCFQTGAEEMTTVCIGTTRFMAPELFDKDKVGNVGVEVDIWALGCILIELFSNKRPWHYISSSNSNTIFYEIFKKKPVPIPDSIPVEIREIIQNCCQYNPRARPSANEVLSQLEELFSSISSKLGLQIVSQGIFAKYG